jgi:predicted nucleic acid-binding protein
MNHVLIDTNAYSALMAGEEDILNVIADADIVYVSVFVIGELLAGFKKVPERTPIGKCWKNFYQNLLCGW